MRSLSLITIALVASSLVAQTNTRTPPTPAQMATNQVNRLTTLLTLNTAQQTQATSIFTTEFTALDGLKTNMQAAQAALTTAIQKNDQAGIATEAAQIGTLTTQQITAQALAAAAFYATLTTDQQTKYTELNRGGFGPGPGGPGGHGPGGPGGPR